MNIILRLEKKDDYRTVEELTREAFWGFLGPTCDEHYLVHRLRSSPAFLPELDFVAQADGKLIGNVMYSKAKVIDEAGIEQEVLTFGPLSVLPEYWNRGIGSMLMRHTIAEAQRLGHRAIVVYGHPDYYPRFGFRNAEAFQITTPGGKNFDALMALPLFEGALDGISGAFHEDPVFTINAEEVDAYDSDFPHKEPAKLLSIDILLDRLEPLSRKIFEERGIKTLTELNRHSGREILTWDSIDEKVIKVINQTLRKYSYAEKLLPSSHILQLAEMGLRIPIVAKLREKKGISVYRVESEGGQYILKVFETVEDRREIEKYKILASLRVPTLPMLKHTQYSLLLPDVECSAEYRLGCEADLSDVQVTVAIAHWYRELHDKGREYISANCPDLFDETDMITKSNLDLVANKTGTVENELWEVIQEHFDEIRHKIDALPRTLAYNDFYWTNLIVAKDKSSAMMIDFNLLGEGYAYGDIRNVTSSLSAEATEAFLLKYGTNSICEEERAADAFLSPLITLINAYKCESFPGWAIPSLEEIKNGVVLESLLRWLDDSRANDEGLRHRHYDSASS